MTLDQLASLGEFVGGIGVIVSLVFVGIQIRQNTNSIKGQSELDLNQRYAELHGRANVSDELPRIWDKAINNPNELSEEEIRRARWLIAEHFLIYEGAFHLYRRGGISEETWRVKMAFMKNILENRIYREWWEGRMTPMTEEFRRYVDNYDESDQGLWQPTPVVIENQNDT